MPILTASSSDAPTPFKPVADRERLPGVQCSAECPVRMAADPQMTTRTLPAGVQPNLAALISTAALRHNLQMLRAAVGPEVALCPAVKANAYGHGLRIVLDVLRESGEVEIIAVANLEEAIVARMQGWPHRVLILGADFGAQPADAKIDACLDYVLEPTLADAASAEAIARRVAARGEAPVRVHIKVDTGMHRLGLPEDEAMQLATWVRHSRVLRLGSVFTHFAMADEPGEAGERTTIEQWHRLLHVRRAIEADGQGRVRVHAGNSAGLLRFPTTHGDLVRPGIALYGLPPSELFRTHGNPGPADVDFSAYRPAMRIVSRLVMVKQIAAGAGVGYGHTFVAPHAMTVGVVPIGYNDGYRRAWGSGPHGPSGAAMRINGRACPVIGRVSMDSCILDLSAVPAAHIGQQVEVLSDDPLAPNSAVELARRSGTIAYEITCLFGTRVHRVRV